VTARLGLLLALLAPVVPWAQAHIDRHGGVFRPQEEVLYLWTGEQVARVFPGFEGLLADVYWLRTVQYFGGQRLFARDKRFELLRPLVEITTALDPRMDIAYRYGAVFLSEPPPVGAGRPREGIEVLREGAERNPASWRLRQNLGFFYFLYLHDARRAAAVLQRAADIPGAAFWLRTLAADLLARGGDRAAARQMWQRMFDQAEEGILKENARIQLRILDALDMADRLGAAVAAYERSRGRRPESLAELARSGFWRGPLVDGEGVPFHYDEQTGKVEVSRTSPLWRPF
jgi:tetratricopeptide (TPR) repeat protein